MSRLLGLRAEEMGLGRERSGRGGARFGPRMRERRPVGLGYVERGKRAAGKEGLGWAKPFHGLDWVLESSSFLFLF